MEATACAAEGKDNASRPAAEVAAAHRVGVVTEVAARVLEENDNAVDLSQTPFTATRAGEGESRAAEEKGNTTCPSQAPFATARTGEDVSFSRFLEQVFGFTAKHTLH